VRARALYSYSVFGAGASIVISGNKKARRDGVCSYWSDLRRTLIYPDADDVISRMVELRPHAKAQKRQVAWAIA